MPRARSQGSCRNALRVLRLVVVASVLAWPCLLAAQVPPPAEGLPPATFERPGDRFPTTQPPTPLEEERSFDLPAIPEPSLGEIQGDRPDDVIRIDSLRIEGNTAIETEVLEASVASFLGRGLAAEGIEALRRRLTEVYVHAGFVNSGAIIPAQDARSGVLFVRIIEGRVSAIRVSGMEHYRANVLRDRVARGLEAPLDVREIEEQIRLLDQDPRIEQIDARLRPGARREEAVLEIVVRESDPRQLRLGFDNDESPSVGAYAGRFGASHANLLGFGDRLGAEFSKTEGLSRVRATYDLPIHSSGTRLFLDGTFGVAELVENSLRRLEIESTEMTVALGIGQPVWHTSRDLVNVALAFERRRTETTLDGEGFSFVAGPDSGRSELSVVRATADWTHRGVASAFTARSMFSFGTDWWNPTVQSGDAPDAIFFSWYGQLRGVYRFAKSGVELRLRGDIQLADRPLLSLEQFAIGGAGSVRGYRRNELVRDQGVASALDVYVPVWRAENARTLLAVTPFVDLGYAWNQDRGTPGIHTLSGVGAGIEWTPLPELTFGLEWAHGLRNTGSSGDLQDESVYLRAVWRAF